MPKTPAAEVDAGGQRGPGLQPGPGDLPGDGPTPEVTKLQVAEYYVAVGDGLMRALGDRPTALERWTDRGPPGHHAGDRSPGDKSDAFYSKRVPKGAPTYVETDEVTFPSGRTADEVCPTNLAVAGWCAQMGTITFHPWPMRSGDNDHPDELRIDLDPQPGTTFTDAVRVAGVARELLEELGLIGYPKTSGNRGVHVYVRIEPRWEFVDVRHAAIGFGRELERRDAGVTTDWWKEERGERIFVDFNQNNRDRTIASAYSLRPVPGAPVSTPMTWEELAGVTDPGEFNLFTVPERLADGDPWAGIDDTAHSLEPLLQLCEELPGGELNYPARLPQDAGRAAPGAAVEEGRVALGRGGRPDRVVSEPFETVAAQPHQEPDQRNARNPREPDKHGVSGAERWAGYLGWVREELIAGVLALSPAERRTTRVPSGWSPIELLSHVLHMEQRWFVWGFLGEQVAEPWGDWSVDEPWAEGVDGRWVVADDVTAEELAERLRVMGRRTTEVLASYPLDTLASAGRAVRRRPTEPGVDLLPRPRRVRAARRSPGHRRRARRWPSGRMTWGRERPLTQRSRTAHFGPRVSSP